MSSDQSTDAAALVVYTQGKVGSKALVRSLRATVTERVWEVQAMTRRGAADHRRVKESRGGDVVTSEDDEFIELLERVGSISLRTVTTVRNPVDTAVSTFFYNFSAVRPGDDITTLSDSEIASGVSAGVGFSNPRYHLDWFDLEFRPSTGIDVYRLDPFNGSVRATASVMFGRNGAVSRRTSVDALVIRLEDFATTCLGVLSDFLGSPIAPLPRENAGLTARYADRYEAFLQGGKLETAWLDDQLSSPYARYFYTDDERDATLERWCP
jgi:hypothetical protein